MIFPYQLIPGKGGRELVSNLIYEVKVISQRYLAASQLDIYALDQHWLGKIAGSGHQGCS